MHEFDISDMICDSCEDQFIFVVDFECHKCRLGRNLVDVTKQLKLGL
jgi:hypothetical protein